MVVNYLYVGVCVAEWLDIFCPQACNTTEIGL